jgi:hypothetical protein
MAVPALVVPVSGPYLGLWNGVALGTQNDDGFVLHGTWQGQEINATDAFGMTLVEGIWRGLNWRMRFRALEWAQPGILNLLNAFGSAGNPQLTFSPLLTQIGQKWSLAAQTLSLLAILGNPPSLPQTLTALNAIIAPQSNTEAMMTSKMREAPFEMVLIPYTVSLNSILRNVSFSTT